jgi:DNA helicase-2/ATP-dependent DNA helicase PcrA
LDEGYLILSTIHSAKGQDWRAVFILNAIDANATRFQSWG